MSNGVWKCEAWLENKVSIIACAMFILMIRLSDRGEEVCLLEHILPRFYRDQLHKLASILF